MTVVEAADGPETIDVFVRERPDLHDIDPDGDSLTVQSVDSVATTGQVTLQGDMAFYDPSDGFTHLALGQTATDSFRYTVSDGRGGTDTAMVRVTVTGQNDLPVAVDDDGVFVVTGQSVDIAVFFRRNSDV